MNVGGANGFGDADICVVVIVRDRYLTYNAIESVPDGFLDGATSNWELSGLWWGHALGICMRVVGLLSVLGLMIECALVWVFFCDVY